MVRRTSNADVEAHLRGSFDQTVKSPSARRTAITTSPSSEVVADLHARSYTVAATAADRFLANS
jgi:hypothetical protein